MRPDPRVLLADADRAAADIVSFTEGMDRETNYASCLRLRHRRDRPAFGQKRSLSCLFCA